MYCRNCNAQNPENSRYCNYCGAPLGDCAPPDCELTAPLNNGTAVVSLILNIAFFNILGLVFAILSLINYNNYESAVRAMNFTLAESYKGYAKKYSKIAIVIAVAFLAVEIIIAIAVLLWLGVFSFGVLIKFFDGSIFC